MSNKTLGAVHFSRGIALLALALAVTAAFAQTLPPAARTVYKCEVKGKIVYSDDPCVGALKLEVEPTRGIDQSAGPRRVGADVQREQHREAIAEVWRPLTGMDAKQLDVVGRRQKLAPEAQRQCAELDRALPAMENRERLARPNERELVQRQLHELRVRSRELRC
jgi:hypothetical protein